jgi:hypothetical protein
LVDMMRFVRIPPAEVDWALLDRFDDRMVSQMRGWLDFVAESQGAEIVVARLEAGRETLGYMSGLMMRRLGARLLGSPLDGWGSPFMGFNLRPGTSPAEALGAAARFAFEDLSCLHFELRDPRLTPEDGARHGFSHRTRLSFVSDLTQDEETLFARMDGACRRCIRKAEKSGVTVETAEPEGFARDYHAQLIDVFAKQDLRPPYGVERVEALIRHLHPTGRLLLLRARDRAGRSIATGIYPGHADWAFFWGNASWREHQGSRPNEALHWNALRIWKARGARTFDWGGGGDYKRKYGVVEVHNPHFYRSRHAAVAWLRGAAFTLYRRSKIIKRSVAAVRS